MNTGRFATPGKTRSCPHCKATILDSATVCPGCQHHLRFDSTVQRAEPALTPLRVEGSLRHPANSGTWEYSVVLTIRDRRGQEIARQVVGVGALQPGDERAFTLAVEVFKPAEAREPKPQPSTTTAASDPRIPARPPIPPRAPAPPAPPVAARPGIPLGSLGGTPAARATVPGTPGAGASVASPSAAPRPAMAPSAPAQPRSTATTGAWPLNLRPTVPGAAGRDPSRKDPRLQSSEPKPQPKRP
jgi:hypothetical protein